MSMRATCLATYETALRFIDETYVFARVLPCPDAQGLGDRLRHASIAIALQIADGRPREAACSWQECAAALRAAEQALRLPPETQQRYGRWLAAIAEAIGCLPGSGSLP
jgi:hypothetical protein